MGAGKQKDTFEELFNMVSKALDSSSVSEYVEVTAGAGKIRISFDSDLLFDPDSSVLKPQGQDAIRLIMPSLKILSPYISKVEIDGHTSGSGGPGTVDDWDLSADRAKNVLKFMDSQNDVDSSKYQMSAFGPYKPIADNNTTDGRQKNRRVEVVVSRNSLEPGNTPYLMDIMRFDYNQQAINVDEDKNPVDKNTPDESTAVSEIVRRLKEKYEEIKEESSSQEYVHAGPPAVTEGVEIPDEAYYETDAAGKPIVPADSTAADTKKTEKPDAANTSASVPENASETETEKSG
jgi:outer membrane protein OmpA-like peptidoglycan-associated protein